MHDCPSDDALLAFLDERLGEPDRTELDAHVTSCAGCRKRIHLLSTSPDESKLRPTDINSAHEPPPGEFARLTQTIAKAMAVIAPVPANRLELPGYEIECEVGRGGMGIVYKARQVALDRTVAIKMLLGGAQAPSADRERFRREATTAASLDHPHIVRVYEVGEHGVAYLAMEFVAGGSLDKWLDGTPWPAPTAATLVETIARAVAHAHERGVVHRDLKPGNILLAGFSGQSAVDSKNQNIKADSLLPTAHYSLPTLQPKVSDFGLARVLEAQDARTRSGVILGTPGYMAPEQVSGALSEVGPPADVYGLGAILYELLTGRPPFSAADVVETLVQVRFHDPVPPRRLRPGLPRDLDTIVMKCLRKEPARRYLTGSELAEDLRRFLHGLPILARPVSSWEKVVKAARRHPWIAALSVLCVVLFAVGFILVLDQWQRAEAQTKKAREARQDSLRLSAAAVLDLGIALCERGDVERGMEELDRAERLATEAADSNLQWVARANLAGWKREWFANIADVRHPGRLSATAFSPDGRWLVTAGSDRTARVWDLTNAQAGPVLVHDRPVWAVAFTPDGTLLTADGAHDPPGSEVAGGEVRSWNPVDGRPVRDPVRFPASVRGLEVSADGSQFLAMTLQGVWRGNVKDKPAEFLVATSDDPMAVHFTPSGRIALIDKGKATTLNPKSPEHLVFDTPSRVTLHAFSPDGGVLATVGPGAFSPKPDLVVRVWNTETGALVAETPPLSGTVRSMAFGPRGEVLATCSDVPIPDPKAEARLRRDIPTELRLWQTTTGRPRLASISLPRRATALAFSPCGRFLLAGSDDGTARVFRTTDGVAVGKPLSYPGRVDRVVFRPDGTGFLIAGVAPGSANTSETVVLCREMPAGASDPEVSLQHEPIVYRVAFSPDGSKLWTGVPGKTPFGWDPITGERDLHAHPAPPADLAWFGRADPAPPRPDELRLWDQAIGQQLAPGQIVAAGRGVVYSADGSRAILVTPERATIWDIASWREVGNLPLTGGYAATAFRPDGAAALLVGVDRSAVLVDAATGKVLTRWVFPNRVWAVAFHPVGGLVAAAGPETSARLWDVERGEPVGPPLSHREAGIMQVAFRPDGRLIATGGRDKTVRLWDVATGRSIGPPLTFPDRVTALTFNPQGTTLAVGVENRRVELRSLSIPW